MATDVTDFVCAHVFSRENRNDARKFGRRANVDRTYCSMSMGRANDF
jgi:hypothetical protein